MAERYRACDPESKSARARMVLEQRQRVNDMSRWRHFVLESAVEPLINADGRGLATATASFHLSGEPGFALQHVDWHAPVHVDLFICGFKVHSSWPLLSLAQVGDAS